MAGVDLNAYGVSAVRIKLKYDRFWAAGCAMARRFRDESFVAKSCYDRAGCGTADPSEVAKLGLRELFVLKEHRKDEVFVPLACVF